MHIKQITISNFRSFRQQGEIQSFCSGTNSVVGRNGSGKSNLFDAIQFVLLAPRFANLRQEERQAILHEGSGSAAVNAFVEIVFDNTDNRFALENADEVVIRRTVGLKKDEFFLQRKRAQKQEISSLLEGAGFSKSNPYYCVQQGKVQDLCTMSDLERLRLLKEVAGTTVYDEKKNESLVKMEENKASIDKVQEILSDIESRLNELESEKEELATYQKLDRQRRALEYCLYNKELDKARALLDQIEQERSAHVADVSECNERAFENHRQINNVQAVLKTKVNQLKRHRVTRQSLEEDKTSVVTRYTKLTLECREIEESIANAAEQAKSNATELAQLAVEIDAKEKELTGKVEPAYDEASRQLDELKSTRQETSRKIDSLYEKQGRGKQFSSTADRDAYLQNSITEAEQSKAEKSQQLQDQQDQLATIRRSLDRESKDIDALTKECQDGRAQLQGLAKNLEGKKRERMSCHEQRKEDWRQVETKQMQLREIRDNMHKCQSDLRKVMPRATSQGLDALKGIVEQEGLTHGKEYFGMLMENFSLKETKFQTAVEVAAQNTLFHVIVDTDTTAAKLMNRLEKDRLGRVTFLPLNQLRIDQDNNSRHRDQQVQNNNDIRSMLESCIEYDPIVARAMQHVFGRKLLARTSELASEYSTKLGCDVLTLDGDLCSRKGALTGGFIDTNKSRLHAFNAMCETKALLATTQQEFDTVKQQAELIDQQATTLMQELQRIEAKHGSLQHTLKQKETAVERQHTRLDQHSERASEIEKKLIPGLEREIQSIDNDIVRLRDEMGTELKQTLSDDDRTLLTELKQQQVDLATQIETQTEKVTQLSLERQKLQSLLEDNLLKRQQELTDASAGLMTQDDDEEDEDEAATSKKSKKKALKNSKKNRRSSVSGAGNRRSTLLTVTHDDIQRQRQEQLEERQLELEEATRKKNEIETRLEEMRSTENELRQELINQKTELEKLNNEDAQIQKELEDANDQTDRLLNKRSMSISKRETSMRKIQELGSLPPPSELEKYKAQTISSMMKSLEQVNKKLKKYSHVNKKAFDQYVNFSEQRTTLLKRKDELDEGALKVKELVESLDRKKDEAINRTFRGVSSHFKDVFKELVPNGAGELIMKTPVLDDDDDDEDDSEKEGEEEESGGEDSARAGNSSKKKKAAKKIDPKNPDVSLYRGIGIKVRFSRIGENFMMSQLSGGQKALVALALIFAIQRCDPAPFYLFDELDQALDSAYRSSVANLIQKQASDIENPTQFIVSTFRPELVQVATRCYGVSHQNKVSQVHSMSKKDALHFIANLMSTEEAVGDVTVTTTQTRRKSRSSSTATATPSARRGSRSSTSSRKRKAIEQEEEDDDDGDNNNSDEDADETTAPGTSHNTSMEVQDDDNDDDDDDE